MTTAFLLHAFPRELLARLRCTADGAALRLDPDCLLTDGGRFVVQGALRCTECGKAFAIDNGIVNMIDGPLVDQESQHEQQVRNAQALEGNTPRAAAPQEDEHNAMEMIPTLEALPAGHGKTLLELGCGDGRYTVGLARDYQWIVAVDFSRESLRRLQRRLGDRRNVALVLGDVTTLKVSDSDFDCVFSTLVSNLPTRDHRNSLYRLAANALRTGGRFVFSAHNHGLRQRLHGEAKSGRYRQGGIYRYNFSVNECRQELRPFFETVKAGPIQIYLPLARTLRLPLLRLSRFLETMPLTNNLGELILCSAERSISAGAGMDNAGA